MEDGEKSRAKVREGVVVSTKMQKTLTIDVERSIPHPRYRKVVKQSKKYYAHCEKGGVQVGMSVRIRETRPLSKLKRWIVIEVLGKKR